MSWSPSSGCSSRVLGVPNKPFAAQNSVCIITVVSFKEVFEAGGYFFLHPEKTAYHETLSDQHLVQLRPHPIYIEGSDTSACKIRHLDDFQCDLQESKKKSTILHAKYSAFFGGEYRDRTGDLLHAMQALSRTVSKHTPTRKCGDRLNIALIRFIHQKGSQLHPASRNHAPPTRQFYHPIFKCVNGFCSERRSFTRKVFF